MWGGLEFFVSLDALVSFDIPASLTRKDASAADALAAESGESSSTSKRPGNPNVRRLHFTRERRLTSLFVYPNATLFLQVLCSTGNKVHLMTPWDKEDTTTILKSSGWVSFLADARRVSAAPGASSLSFASLGIDPVEYHRVVLVVDDAARWAGVTGMQIVEVHHSGEGGDGASSMELLYALSRCVLFAEWQVRYPASSIASCAALGHTTVFAFCRFFVLDGAANAEAALLQLITFHGGRIVQAASEATHVLAIPASSGSASSASPSSPASSSSSASDSDEDADLVHSDSGDETSSSSSSGGGSGGSGGSGWGSSTAANNANGGAEGKTESVDGVHSRSGTASRQQTVMGSVKPLPRATRPAQPASATAATALPAVAPPPDVPATAVLVTPAWVHRCLRALRLVPVQPALPAPPGGPCEEDAQGEVSEPLREQHRRAEEATRTMGALVCALLPPADARPLLWTTLTSIAGQHGYDAAALVRGATAPSPSPLTAFTAVDPTAVAASGDSAFPVVTAAMVLEALTSATYRDVVEVRLLPAPQPGKSTDTSAAAAATSRARGVTVTHRTLDGLRFSSAASELSRIALHRCERRRDKEAVFSHLHLAASQFLYTWDHVQRQRALERHCEAGTQTGGVRHASAGTMTEPAPAVPTDGGPSAGAETQAKKKAAAAVPADAAGAVNEEEWRHHLRNVEGKLLTSHDRTEATTGRRKSGSLAGHVDAASGDVSVTSTHAHPDTSVSKSVPLSSSAAEAALLRPPPPLAPLPASAPHAYSVQPGSAAAASPMSASATSADFTACLIPTGALTAEQQDDFYAFLSSIPLFSAEELGNRVVRVPDAMRCQFASHKGAKDFLRIDFIEFLSLQLPIYPALDDAFNVEDMQRTVADFPLLPLPPAPAEETHEEAQSLWASSPTATATTARASASRPREGTTTSTPPYRAAAQETPITGRATGSTGHTHDARSPRREAPRTEHHLVEEAGRGHGEHKRQRSRDSDTERRPAASLEHPHGRSHDRYRDNERRERRHDGHERPRDRDAARRPGAESRYPSQRHRDRR